MPFAELEGRNGFFNEINHEWKSLLVGRCAVTQSTDLATTPSSAILRLWHLNDEPFGHG